MSQDDPKFESWNTPTTPQTPIPYFKVDPILVLILGIITCGLYLIYWNIKVADVLNSVVDREIISQPIAIFAGCCYPINIYFFYLFLFKYQSKYAIAIAQIPPINIFFKFKVLYCIS